MATTTVIAIGGNSLLDPKKPPTISNQFEVTVRAMGPIADFLEEERAEIGLTGNPEDVDEFERITLASYENAASERAARRRWVLMGKATGGALLAALLLGMLWRLCFGRAPVASGELAQAAGPGRRPSAGGRA